MTLLQHLGFRMPDNSNGHEAASALHAAVSKKVLVAEGSKLRRVG